MRDLRLNEQSVVWRNLTQICIEISTHASKSWLTTARTHISSQRPWKLALYTRERFVVDILNGIHAWHWDKESSPRPKSHLIHTEPPDFAFQIQTSLFKGVSLSLLDQRSPNPIQSMRTTLIFQIAYHVFDPQPKQRLNRRCKTQPTHRPRMPITIFGQKHLHQNPADDHEI